MEGINKKARVITERAYGLKSASSLWTRLVLDLNIAAAAVGPTIQVLRAIAPRFDPYSQHLALKTGRAIVFPVFCDR